MEFYIGAGIALAITLVIASFFGFGARGRKGGDFGKAFGFALRLIAEGVLVVGFLGALVATAVIGTDPAWSLFGGYAAVRAIALILEISNR